MLLGDGKNDDDDFVNLWRLDFLSGNGQTLDCTPQPAAPAEACEFVGREVSCDTVGNPDFLTWKYTGGGCDASDNQQEPGKAICTESDPGIAGTVTLVADDGTILTIDPDEEFTLSRNASKEIDLSQAGAFESHVIHVSCSQPLVAGDVYGSLTLVALDGQRAGSEVLYTYEVTNTGLGLLNVDLYDDHLGWIGDPFDLARNASETRTVSAEIAETTINRVDVEADPLFGVVCSHEDTAMVTVTGLCEPSGEDGLTFNGKEIKWEITNNGDVNIAIDSIAISWPSDNGDLIEVKRDGDAIHKGDFAPTSAVIAGGWEGDLSKRTIKAGETDLLKLKFADDAILGDYEITVTFDQGCSITSGFEGPVSGGDFACSKPIDSLTMIWDGDPDDVLVTAWKGAVGSEALATLVPVPAGGELTVTGYAGSPNDVFWEVFDADSGIKVGESNFHLSCSDDDMDGPEDCGKAAGNGKDGSGLNSWILEGMVDSQTVLDCTDDPRPATGTATSRIRQDSDDVEQRLSNGYMYFDSSDLELIDDSDYFGQQVVGLRFQNLAVPAGATITSASITFETDETDSVATALTFEGEAVADAAPFATTAYHLSTRLAAAYISLGGGCQCHLVGRLEPGTVDGGRRAARDAGSLRDRRGDRRPGRLGQRQQPGGFRHRLG